MESGDGFKNDGNSRNKLTLPQNQKVMLSPVLEYFLDFFEYVFDTGVLSVLSLSELF